MLHHVLMLVHHGEEMHSSLTYYPVTQTIATTNASIGMKAYKSLSNPNDLRLFRPELNMKRLKNSMERLSMPGYDFEPQELIECIAELVRVGECDSF